MFFGFNTNVNYKKWSASLSMRANVGNYVYNQSRNQRGNQQIFVPSYPANQSSDVLNTFFQGSGDFYASNYYVQNASFLKMDNLNMGYYMGKLHNSNVGLRFIAGVQNVFTITKYKGVDPELNGGVDNNQYPRPRTVVLGVNLDF